MDLSLNISKNINRPQKRDEGAPKKFKNKFQSDGGFSFTFTKNNKVKAIVARRRAKPVNKNQKKESDPKEVSVRENVHISSGNSRDLDSSTHSSGDNVKNDSQDNVNLSLNVVEGEMDLSSHKTKKNLSRNERFKLRKDKQNSRQVLSAKEIDEGIKKFSRQPKQKDPNKSVKKDDLFKNNLEAKVIGQRFVKPVTEKLFTGVSTGTLNLHPHLVQTLSDLLNITELTQVQQKTIPRALEGRDLLVRSQTGSGKTLAYALAIVQKLQEVRPKLTRACGIQALIVVPTRELAIQTYELLVKLLKPFTWIVPGILSGGEKRKSEKARLKKGINMLVGTPGRLVDHLLHTENFKLDKVRYVVLDEADRMTDLGYDRDVKKIVDGIKQHTSGQFKIDENSACDNVPLKDSSSSWQSLLLSATLKPAVQKLAGLTLIDPLFIETSDEVLGKFTENEDDFEAVEDASNVEALVIPSTIQLSYLLVPPKLRLVTLSGLLAKECTKKKIKAIVFMATMEMVNYHHDLMNESLTQKVLDDEEEINESEDDDEEPLLMGLRFFKLHGSMTQTERSGVFKSFREAKAGVLITTDVAGRGIDVPKVDLIVQYSQPLKIVDFVHRVGRTARAGRSGRAVIFLSPNETEFVRLLEDRRIRISQDSMDPYLEALKVADSTAYTTQEAAANLQHKFEDLLKEDREMLDKACKAFTSWIKFNSMFTKQLKQIFNLNNAHVGHYARSFAIRETPKSITRMYLVNKPILPTNRLTYTERDPQKMKKEKAAIKRPHTSGNKFNKFLSNSISLNTSEFDSGLPAIKKKKK